MMIIMVVIAMLMMLIRHEMKKVRVSFVIRIDIWLNFIYVSSLSCHYVIETFFNKTTLSAACSFLSLLIANI